MGNFPLAALAVKQPESPIEQLGGVMQLKNLATAGKLQQGQLQEQQNTLQMQQMQLEDQKKIRQAFVDANGDLDQTIDKASKQGVNPQTLLQLKNASIEQKTKLTQLDKDKLANLKSHNDMVGAAAQAVLGVAPELQPQAYALKMKELQNQGVVSAGEAAQPFDLDNVKMHAAAAMSTKDQIDTELKKRDTAAAELKAQTEAKRMQAEMPGGALEDPTKAELQSFLKDTPKGYKSTPLEFARWKSEHAPTMLLQGGMGGAAGDPMVDMVGQGRVDLATATSRMPPSAKAAFMAAVSKKYPEYSQATYGVEKKVQENFTSGDAAKNLTAFNTAIEHSKQLQEAASKLENGDLRPYNKVANELGFQFGSDKTTNFNVIKSALSGEISKVFKGGQATDAEIKEVQTPFDAANSPSQLKGAIANAIRLMNSKRDALKQQYEAGRQGKPNFGEQGGMKVGQSVTIKGKTMKVTAVHPDGSFDAE